MLRSVSRIATTGKVESAAFTAKLVRHIVAIMLPAGIVRFFAGPPLISLLYGEAFAPGAGALRWILPGVVAYAIEIPLGYYVMIRPARPWWIVAIQSASIVACGGLTLATVDTYGIEGAAAARSVTYVGVVLVNVQATGTCARHLLLVRREDIRGLRRIARRLVERVAIRA